MNNNVKRLVPRISYTGFNINVYVGKWSFIYNQNESKRSDHFFKYNDIAFIAKHEEFLQKLTHEEKLRYLYDLTEKLSSTGKPQLCVFEWLADMISEEEAVSFIQDFDYVGNGNEQCIAKLKEQLDEAKRTIEELGRDLEKKDAKIEDLIKEQVKYEEDTSCKFAYQENGVSDSIQLSLREKTVILCGIMRMARQDKDGNISANLRRLISNGETVNKYLKELKSKDGTRPLTDDEKDHIRRFFKEEGLDTAYILDYIN